MNTKNLVIRMVIVFTVMAVAGIGMAVGARNIADAFERTILIAIGSSMFGASLAFFLVRVFSLIEK
jgi:uncharacterized membrane protein YadS